MRGKECAEGRKMFKRRRDGTSMKEEGVDCISRVTILQGRREAGETGGSVCV